MLGAVKSLDPSNLRLEASTPPPPIPPMEGLMHGLWFGSCAGALRKTYQRSPASCGLPVCRTSLLATARTKEGFAASVSRP